MVTTFLNKNFKDIIYIIIILFIGFILRENLKDRLITSLGGYTNKEVSIKIDSTYKAGKVDTIAVFNHYVKTKGIILNPKPRIVYKWRKPNTPKGSEIDSIKRFDVAVKDSLIDGTFSIVNGFNGDLLDNSFKYKPLFPKYITRVDTVKIHTTKTETLTNESAKFGVGIGYNNLQYPSILGSFTTKNNWQFLYEYGKDINSNPIIFNNKPVSATHSLKIIKNF